MDGNILEQNIIMFEYLHSNLSKQIKLKDYIADIYVSEFSAEWERNILDLIPHKDRYKHSAFINSVLGEVKELYIENMKDFVLRSILSCNVYKREQIVCEECNLPPVSKLNIIEEDTRYSRAMFLKRRCLFAERYFLSYPIVRHVVSTAHRILPAVICDFRRYHEVGILTLSCFRDMVLKDIKRGASVIANRFYTETTKAVQKSKELRNVSAKRLPRLVRCLTTVFVQQILNVTMRSIDHIIDIMRDGCCCPRIAFQLVYEGDQLVTKPSMEDVFSTYHDIVRSIENIAQDLLPLEEWLSIRAKERYMKVAPPDWFIEQCHRNLQDILNALFRPVHEHVALVSAEFDNVRTSHIENRMSSLTAEERPDFEAYLAHIREYEEYLSKTNSILSNLYYDVGKLKQSDTRDALQRICRDVISVLTDQLMRYHQDYNRSICADFEDLRSTALDVPKDAESLIRLGEYMTRASKVLMKELERRVHRSIHMLSRLSDITVLTDEHVNLNRTTVNWLHDIQPVFAQNNTLCEAMKSELEEDLQRRINALNAEVDDTFPRLVILDNMDDVSRVGEYAEHYKALIDRYKRMDNELQAINSEEKLFKFPETEFPKLTELRETIVPFHALIHTVRQWRRDSSVWLNGPFEYLDAAVIESKTMRYFDEITETSRTMKSRIKMDATTNKSYKFAGIADDPDPMQQPAPLKLCWQVLNDINEFKVYLPLATCMCNPALEARHWREMSAICDLDLRPNAGTTLRKMIDMNLMDNIDKYRAISLGANKELRLQRELAGMIERWQPVSFEMSTDTGSGVVVFEHADIIEMLLREHLVKIEEMRSSHFVKPILPELSDFLAVLTRIQECLDRWTYVQLRRLFLEPVFSYPGAATRLRRETSLYLEATEILLNVEDRFLKNPTFREFERSADLLRILNCADENLEEASRGVKDYLDVKRLSFPRFFFLEDSEIQRILFESTGVKRHALVKKCFAGIERLKLNRSNCIRGIIGQYGERLRFTNNIPMSTDAECEEEWLIRLEAETRDAVRENVLRCCASVDENPTAVPADDFPSMAIVCGFHLHWTASVERCLASPSAATLDSLATTYADWTASLCDELRNENPKATRRRRGLLTSLLVVASTRNEVVRHLSERSVAERRDFEWIAQLRYYLRRRDKPQVEVSLFDATIAYGYEYDRHRRDIVNTPLTDRCYRTIMQAYRYHLYSGIVGPTGIGKTETIGGLTRALAKPFLAVNCDGDVPYECVTRLLKGVIACGAWICLENFHRLRPEVLSAVAQSLAQMRQAAASSSIDSRSVCFEGCDLNPHPVAGHVCVNVCPWLPGYADLPDNLKALFRFVSMTAPDLDRIAEIELFAGGFRHARALAAKLAVAYKLLAEYLGQEEGHGRRRFDASSLKAVVATAIDMKRELPEDEYALLLRSAIAVEVPRLRNADVPVFHGVMRDCFPDVVVLPFDCATIVRALESVCAKRSLALHPTFRLKAVQIAELMYVRRALALVGEPAVGKTEILRTLAEAQSSADETTRRVKLETVVPGVASNDELFGYFCDKSGSWRDGLCTAALRRYAEDTSRDRKWLVLDGTLMSGAWMENLHTALDANGTTTAWLYLASGERLPVDETVSIVFETTSATEMSPGAISRCGMIYVDSRAVDWRPYARSRVAKCDGVYGGYGDLLRDLFEWAVEPHLNFLRESGDASRDRELRLVASTLNLFEMMLRDACEDAVEEDRGTGSGHLIVWAQAALIQAIVWGLGGRLIDDSQTRFNAFCVSFWNGACVESCPKPDAIEHFDVTLPNEGLIQDHYYVFKGVGNWRYWGDALKSERIPEMCDNLDQIWVPSVDGMKYSHVFSMHIKHQRPFLLYGDVAVGKTRVVRDLLTHRLPEDCLPNFFSFTAMVSVARARWLLLSKLSRLRRSRYGPGSDRYCVNFVDDVSEAALLYRPEAARSVFELLRQLLDHGHCYGAAANANGTNKIFVQDTVFALAVTTRSLDEVIPPRLSRHFNVYAMPAPTTDNIFRIYSGLLLAHLKKNLFAADVTGNVTSMVNATIDVYTSVKRTLRPMPGKLYYFFDMRDMSRVIDGCGLIQKESVETKITFIRLWVHEVLRVFGDRVLDEDDREWLFLRIRDAVKSNFKDSFEVAFDHLPKFENNRITKDSFGDLAFGNFVDNADRSGKCKRYEEITSIEALRNKVLACLNEYNASVKKKKLNVVVSRYMLESLIKISRILSTPGGNVLMISTVGTGRRSTTTLAAFVQRQSLYEITAESYYDADAWRDDLRRALRECGASQKDITYFMSEGRMRDAFLSDVGCLMSTGELPDLFSVEDRQGIIEATRLHAQSGDRNAELSARSVMMYFANQCRSRLHFVLCFSPTNAAFRTYLCSHPNLAKHCTVNCYQEWPDQALMEIAVKHMRRINTREEIKAHAARVCVRFHNDAKETSLRYRETFGRTVHVTSSAFLHMLKLYTRLTSRKQEEIVAMRNGYLAGLEKLELAAEQVEQMKATLTILKPQLELSARQTVITMKEVENENVTVEHATIVVKREEEIANRKAEIAGTLKAECEADLAIAIPILEDAVVALNTLKPTDITLVKAMKNPPDTVKLVMAAVCVMLGVPPDRGIDPVTGKKFTDYWGPSKRILGDMNFLQNLKDYDKDDIAPAVMQVIKRTYMTDNSFMPHIVAKASSAAEGLCKWVRAMVSYDEVAKVVAPKKKKLAAAQTECDETEAFLNEKRRTLAALNAKLAALHDSLRQTLQKKLNLETEVATCIAKLTKAEKLIASLGGEKSRWMQCARNLQMDYDSLAGDLLLSCGTIAYTASYNVSFRDETLTRWREIMETCGIPYTEAYNFANVLGVESEINRWQLCGLSKDRFATENAVILNNSEQWCLFVDPQNQINQWIRTIEGKNDLAVVKLTDSDYVSSFVRNIEKGVPILLENVGESLEVALDAILLKDIYENGTWRIDVAGKSVEYSRNFRLYVTTRLSSPNYTADIFARLTVIDFSMSDDTLRDRLLDIVVSKERPELQEQFEALRAQNAANRRVLRQQEENILSTLSSTATNILEDESAIRALDSSKTLTVDIVRRQEAARATAREIDELRDAYRRFADHCADLFRTLNTLSGLNHMYRFSFSWFIRLYVTSIETSNRSVHLERRLRFLKSSFTRNLHSSVCRSLFERHKLLYSFLLCARVLIDAGQTSREEVERFVRTEDAEDRRRDDATASRGEPPEWLSSSAWRRICGLSGELADDLRANCATWERYRDAAPFRGDSLPGPWADRLTRVQQLTLVRAIRPDRLVVEVTRLIKDTMGGVDAFDSHSGPRIAESYAESSCLAPIIFILPCYGSPRSLVSSFAGARGYATKFVALSMGDDVRRLDEAERHVERARREGGWILLENCHRAAPRWLPRLERICESLCQRTDTSLDFRLWLTSTSVPDFPIGVLQSAVKIAHDYPLRLKHSLLSTYRSEPLMRKEFYEGCPGKDKEFSRLLYGLCCFHAVVRAREHFGALSWRAPYEFGHEDLELSCEQLRNAINGAERRVPLDALLYHVGECNYGGRIADRFDRGTLQRLLESFWNTRVIDDGERSFSSGRSAFAEYTVPRRCEYRDIVAHIDGMRLDDAASPRLFGADGSALLARDAAIAAEFLRSVSSLLDRRVIESPSSSSSSSDREIATRLAIDAIDDKLPARFNVDEMIERSREREPLNAVLVREAESINRIVAVIANTLDNLRSALNGDAVMTDAAEDLSREVRDNEVPRAWRTILDAAGVVTRTLSSCVDLLGRRASFLRDWHENGLPRAAVRFDALSCCKRFLSAALLAYSRGRVDAPVERVKLDLRVTSDDDDDDEEDEDTYYIRGLYLFGARWDTRRRVLIESSSTTTTTTRSAPFRCDMPPIRLTFKVHEEDERIVDEDGVYECPIYVSPVRRDEVDATWNETWNYVTSVLLKTEVSQVHWIKRGATLFCQTDE